MKMLWGVLSVVAGTLAVAGGAVLLAMLPQSPVAGIGLFACGAALGVLGAVLVHLDTKEKTKGRPLPTVEVGKQSAVPEAMNALGSLFDAIK